MPLDGTSVGTTLPLWPCPGFHAGGGPCPVPRVTLPQDRICLATEVLPSDRLCLGEGHVREVPLNVTGRHRVLHSAGRRRRSLTGTLSLPRQIVVPSEPRTQRESGNNHRQATNNSRPPVSGGSSCTKVPHGRDGRNDFSVRHLTRLRYRPANRATPGPGRVVPDHGGTGRTGQRSTDVFPVMRTFRRVD